MASPERDPRAAADFMRLLLDLKKTELKKEEVALATRKVELLEAREAKVKEALTSSTSPAEKEARVREIMGMEAKG